MLLDDNMQIDNAGCVDLIGAPPNGILNLLDHQCRAPQASESSFCMAINLKHKDSNFLTVPRRTKNQPLDQSEGFIVKHYAGEIMYTGGEWLATNNDSLQSTKWLSNSSKSLVRHLFTNPQLQPAAQMSRAGASFASVGGRFSTDLSELILQLRAQEVSFVRCMKPNLQKKAGAFDTR